MSNPPMLDIEPARDFVFRRGGLRAALRTGSDVEYKRVESGWRRGRLNFFVADLLAIRMGMHPVEIWPEWFDLTPEWPLLEGNSE